MFWRNSKNPDQIKITATLVTLLHTQTHEEPVKSFFLPVSTDFHKCQLRRINYTDSTITLHPLRNVKTLRSKQAHAQVNFFIVIINNNSSMHTLALSKALFCIWETAWGVLWVCVRAWERVRVGRGRVCAAAEGAENQYSECTDGDSVEAVTWLE